MQGRNGRDLPATTIEFFIRPSPTQAAGLGQGSVKNDSRPGIMASYLALPQHLGSGQIPDSIIRDVGNAGPMGTGGDGSMLDDELMGRKLGNVHSSRQACAPLSAVDFTRFMTFVQHASEDLHLDLMPLTYLCIMYTQAISRLSSSPVRGVHGSFVMIDAQIAWPWA
ncbi:hypothetical protein IAQ61_010902 [Plenodomus lingam]|uniref:uncharacterized protein n=1 Tax=Leptosphaeria maculans TaxID=5022 RepID=UPI0033215838|nr:hypothetical protein IAQ61_010902 [Plenodomus lingam]